MHIIYILLWFPAALFSHRRGRRLSVSFICTIANYEYAFFYHFQLDGKIEAEVGSYSFFLPMALQLLLHLLSGTRHTDNISASRQGLLIARTQDDHITG